MVGKAKAGPDLSLILHAQTSKSLRRLAADHGALHRDGLPPNYLFDPSKEDSFSDLTTLSVLLTGAEGTPFSSGLFALDLKMPPTYPQSAPTAFFRTKIFHPNVDPATGAICVDTLKRDWTSTLTLRDVLVTISCLLVFPNAASALNSEAGRLLEEDFGEFERKARLWARMHAAVPVSLRGVVEEARKRGDGTSKEEDARVKAREARGKKRVGHGEKEKEEGVFVKEDGMEGVEDPFGTTVMPPFSTPDAANGKMAAPTGKVLGLAFKNAGTDMDESSILMDLDTPSQQPPPIAPRRRQKTFAFNQQPTAASSTTAISFSTVLSTPTPDQASSFTSNITTPRAPTPKRARLSPQNESKGSPGRIRKSPSEDTKSWITWFDVSSMNPRENKTKKLQREKNEHRRLQAAGFDIKKYNSGRFGPRRGIERL
ncbi:Ubiquitin-conjugating enzyme E2 S-C [Venturia nashicola]|uniref:Ubiquitin-conjugating enzyme E2 2 n=1 Tax=Venturia nashicola TaxID=86259 RepID=A0A4Z1NZF2_9PEZI|nr:Ubiquitin-conjugating enzyme E2 S-C [Venturia nashicola]